MEGSHEYELEPAELLEVDPLNLEECEIQIKAQEIQCEEEQIQGGHGVTPLRNVWRESSFFIQFACKS